MGIYNEYGAFESVSNAFATMLCCCIPSVPDKYAAGKLGVKYLQAEAYYGEKWMLYALCLYDGITLEKPQYRR